MMLISRFTLGLSIKDKNIITGGIDNSVAYISSTSGVIGPAPDWPFIRPLILPGTNSEKKSP